MFVENKWIQKSEIYHFWFFENWAQLKFSFGKKPLKMHFLLLKLKINQI